MTDTWWLGLLLLSACFFRDCPGLGTYDKVVSIEMVEAVGHEHLRSYFAIIDAALKPGGKAVIQVRWMTRSLGLGVSCSGSQGLLMRVVHVPLMG